MRRFAGILVVALGILVVACGGVTHGAIRRIDVPTSHLESPGRVVVALPDGEPPAAGWPVLYLLNGYKDNQEAWPRRTALDSLANAYGTLIVCPDGRDSFYFDVADSIRQGMKMESYIINDLVPYIDSTYPVDTLSRSVAGYSMGGHGAMYLTARHPRVFGCAVSLSGALDIARLHEFKWIKLPSLLGAYDSRIWARHSVFAHMDSLEAHKPRLMVVCGRSDALLPDSRRFHAELDRRGVKHLYKEVPGGHDWKLWRSQLPAVLDFINKR